MHTRIISHLMKTGGLMLLVAWLYVPDIPKVAAGLSVVLLVGSWYVLDFHYFTLIKQHKARDRLLSAEFQAMDLASR